MRNSGAFRELFERYLSGTCTPDEIEFLFEQFDLHADEDALRQLIQQALLHETTNNPVRQAKVAAFTERVGERLSKEIASRRPVATPIPLPFFRKWVMAAATLIALIAVGVLVYFMTDEGGSRQNEQEISVYGGEVLPGGNRATLRLADGRIVDLDESQTGIIAGNNITYVDGTEILDIRPDDEESLLSDVSHLMSLTTPKGGTYQVTLPDGSNVWLNSASSLTYPSAFSSGVRVVELEGEAYFEVSEWPSAADQLANIPFIVKTRGQEVEVLGTQFNISAYADDEEVKTTLVEGKVNVKRAGRGTPTQLKPNQQATLKDDKLFVKEVDVAPFVDWKDGLFSFHETRLQDAMNQLSRWYDLEVTFEGAVPNTYFFGKIKRSNSLSNVLNILRKSGLNFRIERSDDQNHLIVLP